MITRWLQRQSRFWQLNILVAVESTIIVGSWAASGHVLWAITVFVLMYYVNSLREFTRKN